MTNKEAIAFLENMIDRESIFFGDVAIWQYHVEALQMSIKALSKDSVEVVRCEDCRHAYECAKSVQYIQNEPNTVTIGYSPIKWCSKGKRRSE